MYLITGGAGFIGSHVAHHLLAGGAAVRVLDNLSTGLPGNLPEGVELVVGDVRDLQCVREATYGMRHIIHLAAQVSVPDSVTDPDTTYRINVGGTMNVIEAARAAGIRVSLASSCAVYHPPWPSPYAFSKKIADDMCLRASHQVLRFFNVYGPRQLAAGGYAGVVPSFIREAEKGEPLWVYGDGEQTRDFIFVEDVAKKIVELAGSGRNWQHDVGTGVSTSILSLVEAVADIYGTQVVRHLPEREGDIKHAEVASVKPGGTPLAVGLQKTVDWFRGA